MVVQIESLSVVIKYEYGKYKAVPVYISDLHVGGVEMIRKDRKRQIEMKKHKFDELLNLPKKEEKPCLSHSSFSLQSSATSAPAADK